MAIFYERTCLRREMGLSISPIVDDDVGQLRSLLDDSNQDSCLDTFRGTVVPYIQRLEDEVIALRQARGK